MLEILRHRQPTWSRGPEAGGGISSLYGLSFFELGREMRGGASSCGLVAAGRRDAIASAQRRWPRQLALCPLLPLMPRSTFPRPVPNGTGRASVSAVLCQGAEEFGADCGSV